MAMSVATPTAHAAARHIPVAAARRLAASRSAAVAPARTALLAPSGASRSRSSISRRSKHGIVTAGWNDFTWGAGSVVSNTPASKDGGLHSIVLKVDNEMAKGYATPGQFCQLRTSDDGKPAFIAIASPPDADATTFELLVKRQEGTAGEICDMAGGDTIQMSPPMGPGFDMNKAPADQFPDTLLFATGSGISPIRALIKSGALAGRNVTLYYGTAAPSYTAFIDEFKEWEAAGVTVKHVQSQVGGPPTYVQDAIDTKDMDGAKTCAVLVGQKEMTTAVIEALEGAGVAKERCIMNF